MFNSSSADAIQYSQLTALLNKTPQAEIRWEKNRDNQQVKV